MVRKWKLLTNSVIFIDFGSVKKNPETHIGSVRDDYYLEIPKAPGGLRGEPPRREGSPQQSAGAGRDFSLLTNLAKLRILLRRYEL